MPSRAKKFERKLRVLWRGIRSFAKAAQDDGGVSARQINRAGKYTYKVKIKK